MFFQKKRISILTSAALLVTTVLSPSIPACAIGQNEQDKGTYGNNINYTYFRDTVTGLDTLSCVILEGDGKMMDLSITSDSTNSEIIDAIYDNQPWMQAALNDTKPTDPGEFASRAKIDEILVGGDITELGNYSFYNCGAVIRLNKNITTIPEGCFSWGNGCNLYIYGDVTTVSPTAFNSMTTTSNIYVCSDDAKAALEAAITSSKLKKRITVMNNPTDIIPLRIAVKKGLMEERLNEVSDRDRYTSSSWDAYYQTVEAGDEKLKDEEITDEDVSTYAAAINEAAEQLISLENLNAALDAADKISTWHYTEESLAALETAAAAGKQVADDATQAQILKLAQDIEAALENLEDVSPEYAEAALSTTVTEAKALVESDYKPESWTSLQEAVDSADNIAANASAADIMDARQDIIKAMNALEIQYPDSAPLAKIFYGGQKTVIAEGSADAAMAGAVKAVIEFDCEKDVSYNPYSSIDIDSTIAGTDYYQRFEGTGNDTPGTTGWRVTITFPAIKEGNGYSISASTWSWANAEDGVYLIKSVKFYDGNDTLLKQIVSTPTAGLEAALTTAQEKLAALKTGDYSADSVSALEDAIVEAGSLLEQDIILPSAITRLTQMLEDTAADLRPADTAASRSKLETALSGAKALKEDDYTADSWKTLQKAVQKAEGLSANALNSEILSVVEEINQAVNALVPAQGSDISTSPEPDASTSPVPDASTSPAPDTPASPTPDTPVSPAPDTPTPNPSEKPDEENLTLSKAQVKKVQAQKSKLSIQLKSTVKNADSYEIVVANNKKFKNSTSTLTTGKNTAKIKVSYKKLKIKKKKTYYLKVRAVRKTTSGTVYGKYSKVIKFKAR